MKNRKTLGYVDWLPVNPVSTMWYRTSDLNLNVSEMQQEVLVM